MTTPLRLTFTGTTDTREYELWREEFCRRVIAADVDPIEPPLLRSTLTILPFADARIIVGGGTAQSFTGIARSDDLVLLLPRDVTLSVDIGSRHLDLASNQAGLADSSIPRARVRQTAGCFRSIMLDRRAILSASPRIEDRIARPLNCEPEMLRLLSGYCDIVSESDVMLGPKAADTVGKHIFDLSVLALGIENDVAEIARNRGLAEVRYIALKIMICKQIADPSLTIARIATQNRCSTRYIQLLFERAGTSFSAFVLEERLQLARRLLQSPDGRARKIADIALSAGFHNLSYFHRAFRQQFQMTPTEAKHVDS